MAIVISSFGFRHRKIEPAGKIWITDVRKTIRNPWADVKMRKLNGQSKELQEFLLKCPKTEDVVDDFAFRAHLGYSIFIGCQGGQHRSVAIAELGAEKCRASGLAVELQHLDLKVK